MTLSIQYLVFSFQHSAFSIQHSAFSIQHPASSIQYPVFEYSLIEIQSKLSSVMQIPVLVRLSFTLRQTDKHHLTLTFRMLR